MDDGDINYSCCEHIRGASYLLAGPPNAMFKSIERQEDSDLIRFQCGFQPDVLDFSVNNDLDFAC